jgi:FMN reductase (NADPH)
MIEDIVTAGQRASTSSNLQMYSVVVTTDPEKRARLKELCGNQRHIGEAPVFMVWCMDLSRLNRACGLQGYEHHHGYVENFLVSAMDVAIAMQNAALAAESMGLGICYIGALRNNPRQVIELFELPRLVFPVCGMTVGWPAKQPMIRPRLPLEAVLHWDRYDPDDREYIREYDRAMVETGIYDGRQVSGETMEPKEYGWAEHSARRVSRPARPYLKAVLEEMGFLTEES